MSSCKDYLEIYCRIVSERIILARLGLQGYAKIDKIPFKKGTIIKFFKKIFLANVHNINYCVHYMNVQILSLVSLHV